jgi:hypothetical protein
MVLMGVAIFLLLALVAALFWLISSPQFVKPQ